MKKHIILSIIILSGYTYLPASQDIRQLAQERLERQKGRLQKDLEQAIAEKNNRWLESHKKLLLDNNILTLERYQQILNEMTVVQTSESPSTEQISTAATPCAIFGLARFKAQLTKQYEQACQDGNLEWLRENQQQLLEKHIIGHEELDMMIEALEEPIKKKQHIEQERAETEDILRITAKERMQKATSTQDAIINGLAWLYEQLTHQKESVIALKEIGSIQNLEHLFDRLSQLTENQDIMAVIGKEIQQLRGHMLYRIWATPQEIAGNTSLAVQALKDAMIHNDFNAMINIYKDAIRKTTSESEAMDLFYNCLIQAIERNDTTAVIDLYLNFLKGSNQEEASLLLIDEYTQCLLRNNNLEALKKLQICLKNTEYMNSLLEAITSLELNMGIASTILPQQHPQEFPERVLWDEWQAACINRNLARLLELQDQAVQHGIVDADVASAIIESII